VTPVLATDYPFWDLAWTLAIVYLLVVWVLLLFSVFADIVRRHDISGWGKTGWIVFAVLLPFLGVFVYVITQNVGMTERRLRRGRKALV
jgi:NADH:ubiquinone oxidoreductase subunit 6 (subunit J)